METSAKILWQNALPVANQQESLAGTVTGNSN